LGQMARYAKILQPDITMVTSVGTEHGRSLKSLEITRAEKAAMVAALPASGLAILNGDDPNVVWMKDRTRARVLRVGLGKDNDLRATDIRGGRFDGTEFSVEYEGKRTPMFTRLIGSHQLNAVLFAAAVGIQEGISLDTIRERVAALEPTPGRLQALALANGATVLRDDFKSGYETVLSALNTLASLPAARKIVVIGDVSEPPAGQGIIYRDVGARIAEIADICLVVSHASGLQKYQSGARRAGRLSCSFRSHGPNTLDTVSALQEIIRPGDLVLIKGRDTQRLERICLALQGRQLRCDRTFCNLSPLSCQDCPAL